MGNKRHGDHGKKVYALWLRVRRAGCAEEWDDYLAFRDWAYASGFRDGLVCIRRNTKEPYSSRNAAFIEPEERKRAIIGISPEGDEIVFSGLAEASGRSGVAKQNVSGCCNGRAATANGWRFRHKTA